MGLENKVWKIRTKRPAEDRRGGKMGVVSKCVDFCITHLHFQNRSTFTNRRNTK